MTGLIVAACIAFAVGFLIGGAVMYHLCLPSPHRDILPDLKLNIPPPPMKPPKEPTDD